MSAVISYEFSTGPIHSHQCNAMQYYSLASMQRNAALFTRINAIANSQCNAILQNLFDAGIPLEWPTYTLYDGRVYSIGQHLYSNCVHTIPNIPFTHKPPGSINITIMGHLMMVVLTVILMVVMMSVPMAVMKSVTPMNLQTSLTSTVIISWYSHSRETLMSLVMTMTMIVLINFQSWENFWDLQF